MWRNFEDKMLLAVDKNCKPFTLEKRQQVHGVSKDCRTLTVALFLTGHVFNLGVPINKSLGVLQISARYSAQTIPYGIACLVSIATLS